MISTTSGIFAVPCASNGFGRYTEKPSVSVRPDAEPTKTSHSSVTEFRKHLWSIIDQSHCKAEALYDLKRVSAIPTSFYKQREAAIKWTDVYWEQIYGGEL